MKFFLLPVLYTSFSGVALAQTTQPSSGQQSSQSAVVSDASTSSSITRRDGTDLAVKGLEQLAPPRAAATIIGPNPSYVGQMVQIEVELLRDERQTAQGAPFFPEIEVTDAIALLSASAPPPETKTIEGISFLGQKRRYLIFPQVTGNISIPPLAISIPSKDGQSKYVTTKPLQISAGIPKGAAGRQPLIARQVKLERTVEGDLNALRVGDAVTVSLRLSAEQTDPVMLPSLKLPDIAGMSSYPGESSTSAHADRGSYRAERLEKITYVATEWGFRKFPSQSVFWLDPVTGNYAEATVPALSFRVRVNPSLGAGCVGGRDATLRLGGSFGFLIVLGFVSLSWWRRFSTKRAQRALVPRSDEEQAAFRALQEAAASGRDGLSLTMLYRWLPFAVREAVTLRELRDQAMSPSISKTTIELEQRIATGQGQGIASDIIPPLEQSRKAKKQRLNEAVLPPLNM